MQNSQFHSSPLMRSVRLIAFSALCLSGIGQAIAHTHAETQSPLAGAVVSAPQEVRITYDEALEPAFGTLVVNDAQGKQVSLGKAEVDATTRKSMHVALPALPAGIYTVKWGVVASDGHRSQGTYKFTVK